MSEQSQLALEYAAAWRARKAWDDLRSEFVRTADYVGRKQLCYDLDTSPSNLSHALAGREGRVISAEWVPVITAVAPDHSIVEILAGLRGLEVRPRKVLTPAEELAELKAAIAAECGPTQREAIERRVLGGGR